MSDLNKMIHWMTERKGKVTYSMNARLGPTSYDCSSAVYFALIAGGFLPAQTMGNTDSLFTHLEQANWKKVQPDATGSYPAKKGDIFIWGQRGASGGAAGHTGIFIDDNDTIIHCNYGHNGISVNDHDAIWSLNGCPAVTIYCYLPKTSQNTTTPASKSPANKLENKPASTLITMRGTFYPNQKLPVSADTNPDDKASPALDYYLPGMAINYDSYISSNGYVWISYISYNGHRRYIAVGPDDGNTATTWGRGFFY